MQKLIEAGRKEKSYLESRAKDRAKLKALQDNYKALNGLYETAKKNLSNAGSVGRVGGGGDYWGGMLNPYAAQSGPSDGVLSAIAPAEPQPTQNTGRGYKALFWMAVLGGLGYVVWTRVF